ncbi:TetR/AcrR family transcriptional regulator [Hoyosella sp. YIM 151337]|uniref:TetR/AcrR family transcriptional regulator n=1 Tax=Hoyosella sp. YIM 151337 TaxID=2992742 RepID=UPI0022357026|nr:TetR/AcrR family transcriptional regulator [Hoyosella sp. YIM 151337]MCW4354291.1 TetR/AcrR family transcriptional regulator [Hoyosella sp. YIM 151337]
MSTRPDRRDGRTTDTRDRIVDVALELFTRKGFAATTMQDIADELGLTKAAVYHYHRTKEDLIRSLVEPAIEDVDGFFRRAAAESFDRGTFLAEFFDVNYRNRRIFTALTTDPTGLAVADAHGWVTSMAAQAQERLVGEDATADQRIRALMAVNGLSRCATLLTHIPRDQLRAQTVRAALELIESADRSSEI